MLGKDAAAIASRSMEPNGAAADQASSVAAAKLNLTAGNAIPTDKGLFAQLSDNPFFTAVSGVEVESRLIYTLILIFAQLIGIWISRFRSRPHTCAAWNSTWGYTFTQTDVG